MRRFGIAVALFAIAAATGVSAAESPVGKWNTVDDKTGKTVSTVDVYEEGGKLFGKIVALTEPNTEAGKPKTCTKCTGPDKDQPIVGLLIVKGLSPGDGRYKGGTILDPNDGKVYKAELWVEDGKLKVRGYLGMFFKTQTWAKAN